MALYFKYSTIVMQHLIVRSIYSINPNEKHSPPEACNTKPFCEQPMQSNARPNHPATRCCIEHCRHNFCGSAASNCSESKSFCKKPLHFAASPKLLREPAATCISAKTFCEKPLQNAAHPKFLRERPAKCSMLKTFWERPLQIELGQNRLVLVHHPSELPSHQMVLACCKPLPVISF